MMVPGVLRQGDEVTINILLQGVETPLSLSVSLWNNFGDLEFTSNYTSRHKGQRLCVFLLVSLLHSMFVMQHMVT